MSGVFKDVRICSFHTQIVLILFTSCYYMLHRCFGFVISFGLDGEANLNYFRSISY